MNRLDQNISMNLKRIRKAKNMSLDMLAEKTGVSKSMLGQIERGESNPTVGTIGKIVDGIHIPFEELIQAPKTDVAVIPKQEAQKEEEANCKVYVYFPYDKRRNFEGYVVEIAPGGCYKVTDRGENTEEYITVFRGTLTLKTLKGIYKVNEGDAVLLTADQDHTYINESQETVVLNITYAWNITGERA